MGKQEHRYTYTDHELIEALRVLAKRLGHTPKRRDLGKTPGLPSEWVYYERWGSFVTALRAAGLKPNRLNRADARPLTGGRPGHV